MQRTIGSKGKGPLRKLWLKVSDGESGVIRGWWGSWSQTRKIIWAKVRNLKFLI